VSKKSRAQIEVNDSRDAAASALVAIGALNWGLVGLFDFDLVATLFGRRSKLSRLVYAAVGASAVYLIGTSLQD
jgi:uncharacterized protein